MYESFYGLKSRPFQLMPDPRLLFESRTHTRALSYLIYGMERREGFVVITGEVGTGKTLLLQTLLSQIQVRHLSVARIATANLDAEAVIASVAGAFGVPYQGRSKFELLDALVARLSTGRGVGSLLILDEAQTCTVAALEELRAISNLQAGGQALVQVVLVGQTELRHMLAAPQMSHLRQRIVASHHLSPLDADEVVGYIEHRLTRAGWQQDRLEIGFDVFQRVNDWSAGIPRRINLLMDRFLVFGFLEEKRVLLLEDLEVVIEEFEKEFGHDDLLVDAVDYHAQASRADADGAEINELKDRLAALERALRNAHGQEKAAALMARHEPHVDREALIAATMRLETLERAMADVDLVASKAVANAQIEPPARLSDLSESGSESPVSSGAIAHGDAGADDNSANRARVDSTAAEEKGSKPVSDVSLPKPSDANEDEGEDEDEDSAADIINSGIRSPAGAKAMPEETSRPHFFSWGRRHD
ncbi:MAG: AAA family ATPase [Salinisphaera sp.]|jgi:general secretion pathway protein A|nr:AAA family ATPase [Salinisphaera sp.]